MKETKKEEKKSKHIFLFFIKIFFIIIIIDFISILFVNICVHGVNTFIRNILCNNNARRYATI